MKPLIKPFPDNWKNYNSGDTVNRKDVQNGLIDTLGYYCSYCEIPLGGYQVEHHKHLKSWQSKVNTEDWSHLLLICKDCRDHIAKEELSDEEKKNMLWPDEHATFALHAKSPFTYEQRVVRYLVLNGDEVHTDEQKKMVFLTPNPLAGEELYHKAKNTLDHFQLNMRKEYYSEASNTLVVPLHHHQQRIDNRTFERSKTWDEAEAAIGRMQQMDNHSDIQKYPQIKEMLLDQISSTAYHKGNWSVWMTVFNNQFPNNHQLLHRLFIKDARYFKAIDLNKLGLNFKP